MRRLNHSGHLVRTRNTLATWVLVLGSLLGGLVVLAAARHFPSTPGHAAPWFADLADKIAGAAIGAAAVTFLWNLAAGRRLLDEVAHRLELDLTCQDFGVTDLGLSTPTDDEIRAFFRSADRVTIVCRWDPAWWTAGT